MSQNCQMNSTDLAMLQAAMRKGREVKIQEIREDFEQNQDISLPQDKKSSQNQSGNSHENQENVQETKWSKCRKLKLTKKQKKMVLAVSIFVLLAIFIPIIVTFAKQSNKNQDDPQIDSGPIRFKNQEIAVSSTLQYTQPGNSRLLNIVDFKLDAVDESTEILVRAHIVQNQTQKIYEVIIPPIDLIGITANSETSSQSWLTKMQELTEKIGQRIEKLFQGDTALSNSQKYKLIEFKEKLLVDVSYNYTQQKFQVVKFQPLTIKQENNEKNKESFQVTDEWITNIVQKATKRLNRILNSNIDAINKRGQKIYQQHKRFRQRTQKNAEQKNKLLKGCRIIRKDYFRCTLEAAQRLDTDFKSSNLDQNLKIVSAFVIKFKKIATQ